VTGNDLSADEAWLELQDMLRDVATDAPQPRHMAARYTLLRDTLIRSGRQPLLPGFMQQCLTLDRFRDFIRLYHPDPEARIDFLNRAFRTRGARRGRVARDFLADAES